MKPESADRARPGRGRPAAEPERVGHHRALREAAEDDPRADRHAAAPSSQAVAALEGRVEGRRVGRRDPAEAVPVRAARRQRERPARRDRRAAAAPGRARRGAGRGRARRRRGRGRGRARPRGSPAAGPLERRLERAQLVHAARGFGSGVRTGSICARRCSNAGGRTSVSPRCSGSSSIAKPGPERGDLEQHAARLAEVDRAEPEAVDHRRRVRARLRRRARATPRARPSSRPRRRGAPCRRRRRRARPAAGRRRRGRRAARRAPPTRRRRCGSKPSASSSSARLALGRRRV